MGVVSSLIRGNVEKTFDICDETKKGKEDVSSFFLEQKENHFFINRIIERILCLKNEDYSESCCIKAEEIILVCILVRKIFLKEKTLLQIEAPAIVVGDIHGQFRDLLSIFEREGHPGKDSRKYVFLGDYVDRGMNSLETMILLFCYKILYQEKIYLLRGNHECANINIVYGFYDECKKRIISDQKTGGGIRTWKYFLSVFDSLPIAAVISERIFCVHGGLSPYLQRIEQINQIQRPTMVPEKGILTDLLWADPSRETIKEWEDNDRGVSYIFGPSIVKKFLSENFLDLICRAHMVVEDGYEFFAEMGLVTIFSAPRYCGEFDNLGAVLLIEEDLSCRFEFFN